MAGESFHPTGVAKERADQYQGRVTAYVIIACAVAAIGGSLFGYDIGISVDAFFSYASTAYAHLQRVYIYSGISVSHFSFSLHAEQQWLDRTTFFLLVFVNSGGGPTTWAHVYYTMRIDPERG
ncbi:hypothetical protein Dimus_035191 [Dionaea muscipula]